MSGKSTQSGEQPLNPRDAAMADIISNRKTPSESEDHTVLDVNDVDEPLSEEEMLLVPQAQEQELEIKPESTITDTNDAFLTIKVNGEEKHLSQDEAIRRLQKEENADKRTQEAVLAKRAYENKLAELQNTTTSIQSDDEQDDSEIDTQLAEAVESIYDGELDKGAEKLAETIKGRSNATQMDAESVREIVKQEAINNSIRGAYDRFTTSERYSHLTKDPYLMQKVDDATVVLQQDSEFMANNPSFDDIFEKAGDMTQDWLDGLTNVQQPDPMQEREERKRTAPKSVTARNATRQVTQEEQPKTRNDVLKDMAKARGQNFVS